MRLSRHIAFAAVAIISLTVGACGEADPSGPADGRACGSLDQTDFGWRSDNPGELTVKCDLDSRAKLFSHDQLTTFASTQRPGESRGVEKVPGDASHDTLAIDATGVITHVCHGLGPV
jgi:hypothetical protein